MTDEQNYQLAHFQPKTAADARAQDPDPGPQFTIGDERFVCLPRKAMPVGVLRRLSGQAWTIERTCEFVESVLEERDDPKDTTPTQIERFRATLNRKDVVVDGALLTDIVVWLIGAVGQRPTVSPSGSNGGRRSTKAGSKAKRSGRALT